MLISNTDFNAKSSEFELIGTVFTFKHFLIFFLQCCNESKFSKDLHFYQRFLMFLGHIQASISLGTTTKFSLLKIPSVIEMISESCQETENKEILSQTIDTNESRASSLFEDLEDIFRVYSN
jgi:hypothetical protein